MTDKELLLLAQKTAKQIRKRTHISGWHEDETKFPECDYEDIVAMLQKAYQMGNEAAH